MQAAIGCEQLKKFPTFIERRRHNWDRLRAALEPAADKLILPELAANSRPSWFGFLISVKPESGLDRNAVTRYVREPQRADPFAVQRQPHQAPLL